MKKPRPGLIIALALPFLAGCFTTLALPIPEPAEREDIELNGVVFRDAQRVEFDQIDAVEWTEESLIITGITKYGGSDIPETARYSLEDLSGILVRNLEPNRTSGIVAALFLIPISIWMVIVSGQSREGCPIAEC
jgi:hypothetical protein|tara:strand:- start:50 stop:454 length:405 start_codon:yes stop_codon:yes gene_type:complete